MKKIFKNLRVVFIFLFFKIKIEKQSYSKERRENRWVVYSYPRKFSIMVLIIPFSLFMIIWRGIGGTIEELRDIRLNEYWNKTYIWGPSNLKKSSCYKKI